MSDLQRRLQLALELARMAVWDASVVNGNVLKGTVVWSPEGSVLLGLEPLSLTQSFDAFLSFVHPDDRDQLVSSMQRRVNLCADYQLEYRVTRADGALLWISARAHTVCDPSGVPMRTLGIVWDITDQKEQYEQLTRQKELAEVTLSSIGDAVVTTDQDGTTTFLNRVAEQLIGRSTLQAAGTDIDQVLRVVDAASGEPAENMARKCLRLRQAIGVSERSELVTREGRRIPIEDSAAPIWSQEGAMLGTVAVFRDVSHERRLAYQLNWQAAHDGLTGLINRREFEAELAHALATAKNEGLHHALVFMDLDHFSIINDTCGHSVGDLLLQLLSKMLQTLLREGDFLARLGGDQLGVLLPACPLPKALNIANKLREAVKEFRFPYDDRFIDTSMSIGLVPINENSTSMTELLIAADHACSMAKEQGRNRVHLYCETDAVLARRQGEMRWVVRLNDALEKQHFRLYSQPIVPLQQGVVSHEEILMRIDSGDGLVMPGDFIPAAERYGMMAPIDRWVIEHVCRHIHAERGRAQHRKQAGGPAPPAVRMYSINLSGLSLNDDGMLDHITSQFAIHGVEPSVICFEITETAVIANLGKAQQFIARLRAMGCRFSLDDFGSGLSSFAYLRSLKVDFLKIDGVFVRDIASNEINRALVRAIYEVGHVMGIQTVAEFVENEAALDIVRDMGIDYAQGYALDRPRPLMVA